MSFRDYYQLAKPGIIRGNLLTAIAGWFLAAHSQLSVVSLFGLVVGLGLVVASACVANNYLDRAIDARMLRTRQRALVTGTISGRAAIVYSSGLLLSGLVVLIILTTVTATILAAAGWLGYVWLYGYAKRRTAWSTMVGALPGALPPVIGYCAVQPPDLVARLLFLVLFIWQLPHFWAIAIYRQAEYQAAGIPLLPARRGWAAARYWIISCIGLYICATASLALWSPAGWPYLILPLPIALVWLRKALTTKPDVAWARRVFGWSLAAITGWSASLVLFGLFSH